MNFLTFELNNFKNDSIKLILKTAML